MMRNSHTHTAHEENEQSFLFFSARLELFFLIRRSEMFSREFKLEKFFGEIARGVGGSIRRSQQGIQHFSSDLFDSDSTVADTAASLLSLRA